MRNLLIAACCAALVGSVSVASAQTSGPPAQDSTKATSPMDSNGAMKKKHTKKAATKSDDATKSDAPKDDAKKDSK